MTVGRRAAWQCVGPKGIVAHLRTSGDSSLCGQVRHATWSWRPRVEGDRDCARCMRIADTSVATKEDFLALGLSYRQLDYWVRQGLLRSREGDCGSGRVRTYPLDELAVATVMLRLVRAGLEVPAAERVARGGALGPGLTLEIGDEPPAAPAAPVWSRPPCAVRAEFVGHPGWVPSPILSWVEGTVHDLRIVAVAAHPVDGMFEHTWLAESVDSPVFRWTGATRLPADPT